MNREREMYGTLNGTRPGPDRGFWIGIINGFIVVIAMAVLVWLVW